MSKIEKHIRWEGNGYYTPFCEVCGYKGMSQAIHSDATARARAHLRTKKHLYLTRAKP